MSSFFSPINCSPGFMFGDVAKWLTTGSASIPSVTRLVPYSMDGPFKQSMNFFLRLAWSSKIQLPLIIAVCFMAFDIRLQLEININFEANNRVQPPPVPPLEMQDDDGGTFQAFTSGLMNNEFPSDLDLDDDESFSDSEEDDDDDEELENSSCKSDIISNSVLCVSESSDSEPEEG